MHLTRSKQDGTKTKILSVASACLYNCVCDHRPLTLDTTWHHYHLYYAKVLIKYRLPMLLYSRSNTELSRYISFVVTSIRYYFSLLFKCQYCILKNSNLKKGHCYFMYPLKPVKGITFVKNLYGFLVVAEVTLLGIFFKSVNKRIGFSIVFRLLT